MEPVVRRKHNIRVIQKVLLLEDVHDIFHHVINRKKRPPSKTTNYEEGIKLKENCLFPWSKSIKCFEFNQMQTKNYYASHVKGHHINMLNNTQIHLFLNMLSSVVTVSLGRGVIACWINQCLSWNMCIFKKTAGCTSLQCILVCPSLHNIVQKLNTIHRVVTCTKIWLQVKSLITGIQWKSNM